MAGPRAGHPGDVQGKDWMAGSSPATRGRNIVLCSKAGPGPGTRRRGDVEPAGVVFSQSTRFSRRCQEAMRVRGQIATVLVLTAALGGGYLGYQHYLAPPQSRGAAERQERTAPIKVEAVVAARKSMARRIEAVGSTRARQSVEIVPMASGRIVAINFTSGQRVKKGD